MIRHPELDSGSHNCINLLNSGKIMKLNIDINKPWKDLFSNKKYVLELFYVILLFVFAHFIRMLGYLEHIEFENYFYYIYLALMANNLINGKVPVLENVKLFHLKNSQNKYFHIFFKIIVWSLLWCIFVYFFISTTTSQLFIIITSPIIFIFIEISFLLFSENFSFKEAFNFKKNVLSFWNAWKEYLSILILTFILYVIILVISDVFIRYLPILKFKNALKDIVMVPIYYFICHLLAQTYKYSFTKTEEPTPLKPTKSIWDKYKL